MKRLALLVALITTCTYYLHSQNALIDSLSQALSLAPEDSSKVDILNELCWEYLDVDADQSTIYCQKAFQLAEKIGDKVGAVNALASNSYTQLQLGNTTLSIELAEKALTVAKTADSERALASAYGTLGNAYSESGMTEKALEFYQKALSFDEKSGSPKNHSYTLHNIAYLKELNEDYNGASEYYQKALDVAIKSKDEKLIGDAYNSMGYAFLNQQSFDSAAYYFQSGLDIAKKYDDQLLVGMNLNGLADAQSKKGNFEHANILLNESIAILSKMKNNSGVCEAYQKMADNSAKQDNHKKAVEYYLTSIQYLENSHSVMLLPQLKKKISESYAAIGETDKAYEYLKNSQILSDSLFSTTKKKRLLELETKYQIEKKEAENKMLLAQKEKDDAIIKTHIIFSIATFVCVILLGTVCLVVWKSYNQKKESNLILEQKVQERTESIVKKNQELKSIIEELDMFNHIASHDIKEPIRVMGNMTGLIRRRLPKDIQEELKDDFKIIIDGARQLYTLMEDISAMSRLKKEPLKFRTFDVNGMANTVVNLLDDRISSSNAVVEIQKLPHITSVESLYTIIFKNLIENGIKYNESLIPRVLVKYEQKENNHTFIFKDNGLGIKEEFKEKIFDMFTRLHNRSISGSGIGLYNVKLAVEKLEGKIKINSEEGKGSEFVLTFPKVNEEDFASHLLKASNLNFW